MPFDSLRAEVKDLVHDEDRIRQNDARKHHHAPEHRWRPRHVSQPQSSDAAQPLQGNREHQHDCDAEGSELDDEQQVDRHERHLEPPLQLVERLQHRPHETCRTDGIALWQADLHLGGHQQAHRRLLEPEFLVVAEHACGIERVEGVNSVVADVFSDLGNRLEGNQGA